MNDQKQPDLVFILYDVITIQRNISSMLFVLFVFSSFSLSLKISFVILGLIIFLDFVVFYGRVYYV